MIRFHFPHATVVRWRAQGGGVVIRMSETVDLIWCLSRGLSLLVGFSMQDEATNVTLPVPQEAYYHADVVYLLL